MPEGLVPAQAPQSAVTPYAGDLYGGPAPVHHPLDRPLAAIRRYKWLVLAVLGVATAGGIAGTRLITPQYEARATVWIESETPQSNLRAGPIRSGELLSSSAAWIELFRSYRIADEVVRQLVLFIQPEHPADAPMFDSLTLADRFAPGKYELTLDQRARTWVLRTANGIEVGRGGATDSVGAKVGFRWLLPASAWQSRQGDVRFTVATPRETSIAMLERLNNRLQFGSNFLWLSYGDSDPRRAARTLNLWLAEYVRVAAELKKRNMVEFSNILEGQVRYAEKATQEAEAAYQTFRVNTITLPTEGGPVAPGVESMRDPALQSFFDQKIQYDNLRHDREAMERSIANASAGGSPYEALLLIPSVAQSPGAEALREAFRNQYQAKARLTVERQSYTDEYPTVKELKKGLDILQTQTIPQLASQLLVQLRDREADYQRRIKGASRELQDIPPRTIEEMRLHRAVVVAEGLYTNLKNRYAEAQLTEAGAGPDVRVLDTAIAPLTPTKNTAPRLVLMSIVAGLGAAIGLALLLDRFDRKIRYTEQATSDLGLVMAGAIPRVPKRGLNSGKAEEVVQFVESFRSLRMHVTHALGGNRVRLAVSSAAPGDGKSLVAANLALSFAESGLRTVLVDGDTRRGALHRMFAVDGKRGLTEYLDGALTEAEVIKKTTHDCLWFVSCGQRHARSPELVASARLTQLVSHLSNSFDVVIFDTPPLAAGIDGYAISAATGSLLMVLRMGQTERRLVSVKLSVLDRLPVNILGAVLNGVQMTGEFQYYSYSPGYSVDQGEPTGEIAAGA